MSEQGWITPCFSKEDKKAVDAMCFVYGIKTFVPSCPPKVLMRPGDSFIVMSVKGLPRLADDRPYASEEISHASFVFMKYTLESY